MLATTILTLALAADAAGAQTPPTHLLILTSGHKLEVRSVKIQDQMALVVDAQGNPLSLRASTIDTKMTNLANAQIEKERVAEAQAAESARLLAETSRQRRENANAITSQRSGRAGGLSVAGNPKAVSKASLSLPPSGAGATGAPRTGAATTASRPAVGGTGTAGSSALVIKLNDIRGRHRAATSRISELTAKQDAIAAGKGNAAEASSIREQLDATFAGAQQLEIEFREAQAAAKAAGLPASVWSAPLH